MLSNMLYNTQQQDLLVKHVSCLKVIHTHVYTYLYVTFNLAIHNTVVTRELLIVLTCSYKHIVYVHSNKYQWSNT